MLAAHIFSFDAKTTVENGCHFANGLSNAQKKRLKTQKWFVYKQPLTMHIQTGTNESIEPEPAVYLFHFTVDDAQIDCCITLPSSSLNLVPFSILLVCSECKKMLHQEIINKSE